MRFDVVANDIMITIRRRTFPRRSGLNVRVPRGVCVGIQTDGFALRAPLRGLRTGDLRESSIAPMAIDVATGTEHR